MDAKIQAWADGLWRQWPQGFILIIIEIPSTAECDRFVENLPYLPPHKAQATGIRSGEAIALHFAGDLESKEIEQVVTAAIQANYPYKTQAFGDRAQGRLHAFQQHEKSGHSKSESERGNKQSDKIMFKCPNCSHQVSAPAIASGKTGRCPSCGGKCKIPSIQQGSPRSQSQNEHRYTRTKSAEGWHSIFSNLCREDSEGALQPQLWLICQRCSMAEALLSRRPNSTDASLTGVPRLVEYEDGSAAVLFAVKNGRHVLSLIKNLFAGSYGDEKPVVLGGAAACVPEEDARAILGMFGRKEALAGGSVIMW